MQEPSAHQSAESLSSPCADYAERSIKGGFGRTEHHEFTWICDHLGIDVEIAYTPNLYIYDHLGIHAVRPAKIRLPISETGYRSHYVAAGAGSG